MNSQARELSSQTLCPCILVSGMFFPQISSCLVPSLLLGPYSNVTTSKTCPEHQIKHTTLHTPYSAACASPHLQSPPCVMCVCSPAHSVTSRGLPATICPEPREAPSTQPVRRDGRRRQCFSVWSMERPQNPRGGWLNVQIPGPCCRMD